MQIILNMIFKLETTNAFEKDLKRLQKRNRNISKLKAVIDKLTSGEELAARHKNHKLSNTREILWDCHIEPDWILLYSYSANNQTIHLIRTGSHSDLFG